MLTQIWTGSFPDLRLHNGVLEHPKFLHVEVEKLRHIAQFDLFKIT